MNNITPTLSFPITSGNGQTLQINSSSIKTNRIEPSAEFSNQTGLDKTSKNRLDPLLERLRPDLQQTLIDSKLGATISTSGDDYIGYLNSLDDETLTKTVSVLQTLSMNPNVFGGSTTGGINRFDMLQHRSEDFITTLKGLDENSRTRVLDKMVEFGKDIIVTPLDHNDTYTRDFGNGSKNGTAEANNLHNFLNLIKNSDDINETIDKIESFPEAQQSDVMFILTSMPEQEAGRVLSLLDDKSEESQTEILKYFGDIAKRKSPLLPAFLALKGEPTHQGDTYTNRTNVDERFISDTAKLLEDSFSLVENFNFEEADLNKMLEEVNTLNFNDQRSFINVSLTGLELLEGKNGNVDSPITVSAENNNLIDSLRNDPSVLKLLNETAFGEELKSKNGFLLIKDVASVNDDQKELIKVLTLHSKLNENSDNLTEKTQKFVANLSEQDANSRDNLVDKLIGFIPSAMSVEDQNSENLAKDFKAISNALSSSQNINELLNLEPTNMGSENKNQVSEFWQAMEFAEDKVDLLVDVLKGQSQALQTDIIKEINNTILDIEAGKKSEQDGKEWFDKLLDDPQKYIEK